VRGRQLDARNGDLSITAADQNFIISKKIIIFAGPKNYKYDLLIITKQYDKYGSEIKRNKSATAHRYRRRRGKLIAALQSAASSVFGSLKTALKTVNYFPRRPSQNNFATLATISFDSDNSEISFVMAAHK